MNTHLDIQLLMTLGKGLLLCAGLFALAAIALRGRSAQTTSLYWRGGVVALLVLPVISFSFPWLPVIAQEKETASARQSEVSEPISTELESVMSTESLLSGEVNEGRVVPLGEADPFSSTVIPSDGEAPVALGATGVLEQEATVALSESGDEVAATRSLVVLSIWGLGALFVLLGWARSSGRLRRLARNATRFDDWSAQVANHTKQKTRVLLSSEVSTPLVWGILRPSVLLPKEAKGWSAEQREQVLAHELCHLRRRDPLFLLLARLALALHWPNPIAWLVTRRLRLADERTADDAVLQAGSEPGSYASLLASFARRALAPAQAAAPSMASGSTVGVRVERILDGAQRRGAPRRRARMLLWGVLASVVALVGGVTTSTVQAQEAPPNENVPPKEEDPFASDTPKKPAKPAKVADEGTPAAEPEPAAEPAKPAESPALEIINYKIKNIIIPVVDFDDTTLSEGVDFMRLRARELDTIELDPDRKGINFVIIGDAGDKRVRNLKLRNIPLKSVLDFLAEQTGTSYEVGEHAVTFRAKGKAVVPPGGGADEPGDLLTKAYRVPPTFLDDLDSNGDPFGERAPLIGLLKQAGIEFGKGASVQYNPSTSKLIVRARIAQLDLVDSLVDEMTNQSPKVLKVRFELYELDKVHALSIAKTDQNQNHGAAAYQAVQALQQQKLAKLLMSPSVMTRPGQNATAQAGTELTYIKDYAEKDGKDVPVNESLLAGSRIMVEPNIGADNTTIDVRYSIYLSTGEPKRTTRRIKAPVSGDEVEVESVLLESLTLNPGGITTLTGQTQLLGTMRSSHPLKSTKEVVVFLTAHVTKVAP